MERFRTTRRTFDSTVSRSGATRSASSMTPPTTMMTAAVIAEGAERTCSARSTQLEHMHESLTD